MNQLETIKKLGKNLVDLGENPKQLARLMAQLKDLDKAELKLVSECLCAVFIMKKSKRMALWKSIKIFLEH